MVFPQTLKLERLADKLCAMTALKNQEKSQESEKPKPLVTTRRDPVWDNVRVEIQRFVPEVVDLGCPDLLLIRSVFTAGIRDGEVLKSLAALSLTKSFEARQNYDRHVLTLAQCLAQCSPVPVRKSSKLALIRTLMTLRSPLEVGWQIQEEVVQDSLLFITSREYVWEYLDHFDEVLLWELRAITLMEMERRSDRVASFISKQAVFVKGGLQISTSVVNAGIEGAAAKLKEVLEPDDTSLIGESESNQAMLAYSEKAKRATDNVRLTSQQVLVQFQSTSAKGIHTIANRIHEGAPNEESRRKLCAVGKVGLASVGAAALVADTLIESTGQVAKKTAAVTADVVEHKYGSRAGKLVRNASGTAGNIARTLGHVALLHKSRAMTKSVAKATGKAHLLQIDTCLLDEFASDYPSSDDGTLFAEPDDDMFQDEVVEVPPEEMQGASSDDTEEDSDGEEFSGTADEEHDVLVLDESKPASPFDSDAKINMTSSELDSCLPDQITSVDAQSDFFSDVTNEPVYERTQRYSNLLRRAGSSRHSIFRNLEEQQVPLSPAGGDGTCKKPRKALSRDDDDGESLDYTACTVEETYLTNSTLHDHHDDESSCLHLQQPVDHDDASQVSGFEKHYEAWATGSEVSAADVERHDPMYQANLIPPNGYVLSEAGVKTSTWQRGLYSSVNPSLGCS